MKGPQGEGNMECMSGSLSELLTELLTEAECSHSSSTLLVVLLPSLLLVLLARVARVEHFHKTKKVKRSIVRVGEGMNL